MKVVTISLGYIIGRDDYGIQFSIHDVLNRQSRISALVFPWWVQPRKVWGFVSILRFSRPIQFVRRAARKLRNRET